MKPSKFKKENNLKTKCCKKGRKMFKNADQSKFKQFLGMSIGSLYKIFKKAFVRSIKKNGQ